MRAAAAAAAGNDWAALVTVAERVARFEESERLRYAVQCDLTYLGSVHGVPTQEAARDAARRAPKRERNTR